MVDRLVNSEVNARRIAAVDACFGSSGRQPLYQPGRVLVGEGVLVKMCRKKPKPRQFFLFNDVLVYGTILISKKRYNTQHVIGLEEVNLENLEDDGEMKNGWLVKTPAKSFAVYAATSTEKKEWMLHIQRCIQDLLAKSGKSPATQHAAVWIPDSEAQKCMVCRKTTFTLVQRRHHCRACGSIVCSGCSSKRLLMASVSKRPVRVCDECFDKEATGRNNNSTAAGRSLTSPSAAGGAPFRALHHDDGSSGDELSDDDDLPEDNVHYDQVPTFYGVPPGDVAAPTTTRAF